MNVITGIHAVREALESGRAIDRISIARGRHGERVEDLVRLARQRGVPVRFEDRAQVDRLADRITKAVAEAGVTEDEIFAALDEERERFYAERYDQG